MNQLIKIASNISTPLALAGLCSVLFFLLLKETLKRKNFFGLHPSKKFLFLKLAVDRLFRLAVLTSVLGLLGFGLTKWKATATQNEHRSINQNIVNSPGAIQSAGNVTILRDKRIISSLEIEVEAEPPAEISPELAPSFGFESFIALFSKTSRIRFGSSGTFFANNANPHTAIRFLYTPETPSEILGKEVDFLSKIEVLGLNYSEIGNHISFQCPSPALLRFSIRLNGVEVARQTYLDNAGQLAKGQLNLSVTNVFKSIPQVYADRVSAGHDRTGR